MVNKLPVNIYRDTDMSPDVFTKINRHFQDVSENLNKRIDQLLARIDALENRVNKLE